MTNDEPVKTDDEYNPHSIQVVTHEGSTKEKSMATLYMQPSIDAAITINIVGFPTGNDMDINQIKEELDKDIKASQETNIVNADALLISQAHTLDKLFQKFVRKTLSAEYIEQMKGYSTLALKAQNQCRMTLGTLAEIKNPRPYIQNNKAQYQQVNNGVSKTTRTEEKSKTTNELLEDKQHEQEWLDTGTQETASGTDKKLEAMGEKHRSKD